MSSIFIYFHQLRGMNRNAKLFLIHTFMSGLGLAVLVLLYNLYILSLGFKQDMIGLVTLVASTTAVAAALPMGLLTNRIGYKRALTWGILGSAFSIALPLAFPFGAMLIITELVWGVAFTLFMIVGAPFMAENSTEEGRTHLFSIQFVIVMLTAFGGSWFGGALPRQFAELLGVGVESPEAYRGALAVGVVLMLLSAAPLFFLKSPNKHAGEHLARPRLAVRNREMVARLLAPQIAGALAAGMFIPFVNVIWRLSFNLTDDGIGTVFAISALLMAGAGLLTPLLNKRWGIVRIMLLTRLSAIGGLVLFGFAPWFGVALFGYFLRDVLMNIQRPLFDQYTMDQIEPAERAAVSAYSTMGFNLAWGAGSWISGIWQTENQIGLVFGAATVFYLISLALMYGLFKYKSKRASDLPANVPVPRGSPAD